MGDIVVTPEQCAENMLRTPAVWPSVQSQASGVAGSLQRRKSADKHVNCIDRSEEN